MDLSVGALALLAVASLLAGIVNALAGGGTLITFPTLTAVGVPAVQASVMSTVALTPGYLGGACGQRDDLDGQQARLVRLLPAAAVGGAAGALLLVFTAEAVFRAVVPWLIFLSCALLAVQHRVRAVIDRRAAARPAGRRPHHSGVEPAGVLGTFAAAIYGGYFGAGLGIILLGVLGTLLDDNLRRINALKQGLSLFVNVAATLLLLFSGKVIWVAAVVMATASLAGGALGGRLAGRLDPEVLRRVVIAVGLVAGVIYLIR
jgi:uncharacterized protein